MRRLLPRAPRRPLARRPRAALPAALATTLLLAAAPAVAQEAPQRPAARPADSVPADPPRIAQLKREALADVDGRAKFTQEMVDMIFSFGELGYQEVETTRYITDVLRRNGFTVRTGVAGMPSAWVATWGSGSPVIAIGSDVDGIPQASQKPGVAFRAPLVEGAPGHGEGHNSGQAVNITAALAAKKLMERDKLPGTLVIWPGTAEELVGGKAYLIRDGLFKDVDIALFSHVSSNLSTAWGSQAANGLVSLEYAFRGKASHAAGQPWAGRSALDAVELMNVGWNYRREHLRYQQRSHYVVRDGGDQPNVVPSTASVWYYLRETDHPRIMALWAVADSIAQGAAMMTGTELQPVRVLGSAWPQHFNKPIAEAMQANIERVGMPEWSEADQQLARAVQELAGGRPRGLGRFLGALPQPVLESQKTGGGSDDIGDVSWVVPTVTLRYPANIPGTPGHSWVDAIAMATPIAHKGSTAGAKVMAATILDILTRPELVTEAKKYFTEVQTKDTKYTPLIRPQDRPATDLNVDIMARYRDQMRKFYYDPSRYGTYLEQLGITYPTVKPAP
jgi:aminobenzoyl-glutamate utilization protein B